MANKISTIQKPISNIWKNAKRFRARFFETKYPICGTYLVYAVLGRKWAMVSQWELVSPCGELRHQLPRFRMHINEWNKLPVKEEYNDGHRDMAMVAAASSNN